MGRLKRGNGERTTKDKLHILLSLHNFISVLYSPLSHEDTTERGRQLNELRMVREMILRRDEYFKQATDEYYGNNLLPVSHNCDGYFPTCCG